MCDEFNVQLDHTTLLVTILSKLDFRVIIVVENTRDTWLLDNVEIAIDNVKELRDFIELEMKGAFNSKEHATEHPYGVLKQLNAEIGKQDFKGYPHRLLKKKQPAVKLKNHQHRTLSHAY